MNDLANAKKWCEEARKLLKIETTFGYDESVDSKELYKARKQVETDLENLKKQESKALSKYEQRYIALAKQAKEATDLQSQELARTVTAQLQFLHAEISGGSNEESQATLLKKVKAQYELSLSIAENRKTLLAEKNVDLHLFSKPIEETISLAKKQTQPDGPVEQQVSGYIQAMSVLSRVEGQYKAQLVRHSQFGIFQQKLAKANLELAFVKAAHTDPNDEHLKKATGAIDMAVKDAGSPGFNYVTATKTLEVVHAECKLAKKSKSFDSKALSKIEEAQKKLATLKSKFEVAYTTANEKYIQSSSLFGAVTNVPEVVELREEALQNIERSRTMVDLAMKAFVEQPARYENYINNLTESKSLVTAVTDKLIPKATKLSEEAKKLVKAKGGHHVAEWQDLLRKAEIALEEMKRIDGAGSLCEKLSDLIEETKESVADGQTRRDYPAAITQLQAYKPIHEEALKLKGSPLTSVSHAMEFKKLCDTIASELRDNSHIMESYLTTSYQSEVALCEKTLLLDPPLAIAQMEQVGMRLMKDLMTLEQQRTAARLSELEFEKVSQNYFEIPEQDKATALHYMALAETRLKEKAWSEAKRLFDLAATTFKQLEPNREKLIEQERQRKESAEKLNQMMAVVVIHQKWPPTSGAALKLADAIRGVRSDFQSNQDIDDFVKQTESVVDRFNEFQKQVANQKLPENLDSLTKFLNAFDEKRRAAVNEVEDARMPVDDELSKLQSQLSDIAQPGNNDLQKEYQSIRNTWLTQEGGLGLDTLNLNLQGAVSDQAMEQLLSVALSGLEELKLKTINGYNTLLNKIKNTNVDELQNQLKLEQDKNPELLVQARINALSRLGVDVSKHQKRLVDLKTSDPETERTQKLLQFAGDLVKLLEETKQEFVERKKACEQKSQKGKQLANQVEGILKDGHLKFKSAGQIWITRYDEFKHAMLLQLKDAQSLYDSDDPDLIDLANEQLRQLWENVKKVTPDAKPSFDDVHKLHKELVQLLGVGTDRIIAKYLKDTHQRLNDKINAAFVIAQKSSPQQGIDALEPLRKEIETALALARERKKARQRYEERKVEIMDQWTRVKKLTGTYYVGTRMTAFTSHLEGTIEVAESLRKQENGGIEKAVAKLNDLKKELDEIEKSDGKEPRQKMIEKDSQLASDERLVKEMVRQFKEEVDVFKQTRISLVTEAFAKKSAEKTTEKEQKIELAEGKKVTEGMKKRLNEAKKLVGKLSDNVEVAKQQLFAAREILREQENVVQRFVTLPQTTNVNLTKNLPVVQQNWKDRVATFIKAVEDLAKKVEVLDKPVVETTDAKTAANLIRGLKSQFAVNAFDRPLAVLKDEKDPAVRRAAREEALRVMRYQRDKLLQSEVLEKLAKNPIDGGSMMAALGYLRQSLKSIEIEVLVGV